VSLKKNISITRGTGIVEIFRDAPDIPLDNPAFFMSGFRPDTGIDLRISGRIQYTEKVFFYLNSENFG
jgi:hypothetical protein